MAILTFHLSLAAHHAILIIIDLILRLNTVSSQPVRRRVQEAS